MDYLIFFSNDQKAYLRALSNFEVDLIKSVENCKNRIDFIIADKGFSSIPNEYQVKISAELESLYIEITDLYKDNLREYEAHTIDFNSVLSNILDPDFIFDIFAPLRYKLSPDQMKSCHLDVGMRFKNIDEGLSIMLEGLGYKTFSPYRDSDTQGYLLYGPIKDLFARAMLERGFAQIYVANEGDEIYEWYDSSRTTYIGKVAPLLKKVDWAQLCDILGKSELGLKETLKQTADEINLEDYGFKDKDQWETFQAMFGIVENKATGELEIAPNFQQWWVNYENSNKATLPKSTEEMRYEGTQNLHFLQMETMFSKWNT